MTPLLVQSQTRNPPTCFQFHQSRFHGIDRLGVGGVLGLGEHYVAVAFDKLRWVDQPVTSTTASTTSAPANTPATTSARDATTQTTTGAATTTTTTTTTSASKHWYPDHAVYNATKDELKAMPEFKY